MQSTQNSLVLHSGGIDSTACIHHYLDKGFDTKVLFIDYGQVAMEKEKTASINIANHYNIKHQVIKVDFNKSFSKGKIIGRNAFLIMTALMNIDFNVGLLSMGIHSGTDYRDCSTGFVKSIQDIFDIYTDGTIVFSTPFIEYTKSEIYKYCKDNKIPLELTYSCELGKEQPCGDCISCKDLINLANGTKN